MPPSTLASLPPVSFSSESVQRRINYRVGRLARRYRLGPQDRQDLRQELWLAVVRAGRRFDPALCPAERFIGMVLNRHCKHHVRQLSQARRRPSLRSCCQAVDTLLPDPHAEADLRRADLRDDVRVVLATLREPDRRICQALMEHPPYRAARQLGICASTLYRTLRRLRPQFAEAGVDLLS